MLTLISGLEPSAHWTEAAVSALGEIICDGAIHPKEKVRPCTIDIVINITIVVYILFMNIFKRHLKTHLFTTP